MRTSSLLPLLLVLLAAPSRGQQADSLSQVLELSLPDRRPVAFTYVVTTDLDGGIPRHAEAQGIFQGIERSMHELHVSTWPADRRVHFLTKGACSILRNEKRDATGWRLYLPSKEREDDPFYEKYDLPRDFLNRLLSLDSARLNELGTQEFAGGPCIGYSLSIESKEDAHAILFERGLALSDGQEIGSTSIRWEIWVGTEDWRLRQARLLAEVSILTEGQAEKEHRPEQAGWSWETPGGGTARPGGFSAQTDIQSDPTRQTPRSGNAAGSRAKADKRTYHALLVLDQVVEGKVPDPIRPDPEAARLVDW